ncbi:MAG TPA: lectin-like protein [Phycisphaerales bacterium]|nr:lectin-like protein [Phycisphaerales bacterium]
MSHTKNWRGQRLVGTTAAALCLMAGVASAQIVDTQVPLNYNWHGMATSGEVVTAATPSNADNIQYRAISDRGLYFEPFDPDSIAGAALVSATGITYGFYNSLGYANATDPNAPTYNFDIVHLGARGPWYRNWDSSTTTDAGPAPAWADPSGLIDHTGLQTTVLANPITVDGATEIGVLYTVSDGGGQFECILTFWNGSTETNVPVRLNAPDWFGAASDPGIVSPFVTVQKRLAHTNGAATYVTFRGVQGADSAHLPGFSTTNAGPNLNVIEAVISVPRMVANGINVAGQQLTKITFGNAMYPAVAVTGSSGNGTTATLTTGTQTYVAGQPIVVTGLNPSTYNYSGPLGGVISGTQFSFPSTATGTSTAQMQLNSSIQITSLTGNGTVSTATTAVPHGLSVGDYVTIGGCTQAAHNGRQRVNSVPSATQFTFTCPVNGSSGTQRQVYRQGVNRGYMIYSVTARTGQPANSTPANAQQVFAGDTLTNNSHAFGAAPSGCGVDDTSAVWYSYTANTTGGVEVRTCGAGFDTTLAVYTSGLSPIDCNDNGCGAASRLTFSASSGSTYLIRVAGRQGATGNFTLHIDDPAHVDITMPLQFNWNGICHGPSEQTVTTPVAHENRSDLNGYRAIADRGLLCDGVQSNALNFGGTLGHEGMIYNVYATALQSDMVHLGDRALAAGGIRNWSAPGTTWPPSTSDNGLRPAWLNQDSQPTSTSSMSSLNAVFGPSTQIGVLYHMANGGSSFGSIDMTLAFTDTTSVTVTLDATDWFETNVTAMPAARTGVLLQRKTGPWRAVQNTDRATDAGVASGRLWVNEAVVTTGSLQGLGFDATGKTLQSITFGNVRSAPNGAGDPVTSAFGVFAATLRDPASYNIVAGPGGVGTVTPNQLVVGATGKMTVSVSRGTGSPNNITSVIVDGSSIGVGNITLNDSGTNGDTTPNDNVFSRSLAFPVNTTPGTVTLPFTVTDAQSRTASGNIIFTMTLPSGTITPNPVRAGDPAVATMTLPNNGNIAGVTLDLAQVGGTSQALNDSGVNGDVTAADGVWSVAFTMPTAAAGGTYNLPLTVTDVSSNSATGSASVRVIAAPGNAADLGTLANGVTTFSDSLTTTEVKWVKFTIANEVGASTFLDIDTEGSAMAPNNDTELGIYDSNGNLVATDDDDGSNLLTALSFGAASPARPAFGNGVAYNGRDGATLAAGTYYMAYAGFNSVFNATEWSVTSPSTYAGPVQINLRLGAVPTGGVPTTFTDLGTIGTNPVVGNGAINAPGGTQWFRFIVPTDINTANRTYLDIDTEGSGITNTVIGLFRDDGTGTLVSQDDEDGSGSYSQLTYGRGTRNAVFDGLAYNGRDGATLAAGTYYLAVTEATAAFGNNFIVFFNSGTSTGPVTVNIGRGEMPPPSLLLIAGPIHNDANNSDYYLYDRGPAGPMLWTDAEAFAVSLGGHLASIADAEENEFVRSQVVNFGGVDRRAWIGLNDAASINNYVWSDGTPVNFLNWAAGEPNHANGTEFYAEMLGGNGLWNDQDNDGPTGPGCFTIVEIAGVACPGNECGPQDYNGDGDSGTDQDIEAFFACLGGTCCETCFCQGSDFNGDGDFGTDQDIEAFFRVLGGNPC